MGRTFRREPYSVSVGSDSLRYFTQTQFKGLCDIENVTDVDQQTFTDVQNMYVDENGVLSSRPPILREGDAFELASEYIIDEWIFGTYKLRLYRYISSIDANGAVRDDIVYDCTLYDEDMLAFRYVLRAVNCETVAGIVDGAQVYDEVQWGIPISSIGWDYMPKVTCAQIEDKVYIWFASIDFVVFNTRGFLHTDGVRYPYFESGAKYIYCPVHKLVVNGIETTLETKNFLSSTYKKRHQYSALSSINLEKLVGKQVEVGLNGTMTQDKSKHLYDVVMRENQTKMLIYPYSSIGMEYYTDIVQTARALVALRYSRVTHFMSVSYDGTYFQSLPVLHNTVGNPVLTRDGLYVIAFTTSGIAKCKLVAQESGDFAEDTDVLKWVVEPYMPNLMIHGQNRSIDKIDASFSPTGYFETIDQYAYIFRAPSIYSNIQDTNILYLYAEWLNGINGRVCAYQPLYTTGKDGSGMNLYKNDDIKLHFRYVAPTIEHPDLGAVVSVLSSSYNVYTDSGQKASAGASLSTIFLKLDENGIGRVLSNNDAVTVYRSAISQNWNRYLHKLDATGRLPVKSESAILSGDTVLSSTFPFNASEAPIYDKNASYNPGDYVEYSDYLFVCKIGNVGVSPLDTDCWEALYDPLGSGKKMQRRHKETKGTGNDKITAEFPWGFYALLKSRRYVIENTESSTKIPSSSLVKMTSKSVSFPYTNDELNDIFGPLSVTDINGTVLSNYSWSDFYSCVTLITDNNKIDSFIDRLYIMGANASAYCDAIKSFRLSPDGSARTCLSHCQQLDVQGFVPTIGNDAITYEFLVGYNMHTVDKDNNGSDDDYLMHVVQPVGLDGTYKEASVKRTILSSGDVSQWFRITPNANTVITDRYLYENDEVVYIPQNGILEPFMDDTHTLKNNDRLIVTLDGTARIGNIHKASVDGLSLELGSIESGDLVFFVENAVTEEDYMTPSEETVGDKTVIYGNLYIIEHVTAQYVADEETGIESYQFVGVVGGEIKVNDFIRLRAYGNAIVLPVGHPGNSTDSALTVSPRTYPQSAMYPDSATGDEWPSNFPSVKPLYPTTDGGIKEWEPGDSIPIGAISYYGITSVSKRIEPICVNNDGAWYNIDGTLWTSSVSERAILEIDEYVNASVQNVLDEEGTVIGQARAVDINLNVPDHCATMNEHYFSYADKGRYLLEISQVKRDENKVFTDEGTDLLLYLPGRNEQYFANKITALHPLSNTEMGVFTEKDIWYVGTTTLSDGTIAYTSPVKSKLPVGLRDGDDVITALDGQAIVFPTSRGLVALAPQDFVATTEKTLSFVSDTIQRRYGEFYGTDVMNAALILPGNSIPSYKPQIQLCIYKYWILMYKRFDRTIYVFDMRSSSWWIWTTPCPIRLLTSADSRLYILQQVDFSPVSTEFTPVYPLKRAPLMGVSCVLKDTEVYVGGYKDYVVDDSLAGTYQVRIESTGRRYILDRASSNISWYFKSQRLHLNEINAYKCIKGINLNLMQDGAMEVALTTKVFRDTYHPEQGDMLTTTIDEIRTFSKRLNLMHVVEFQYDIQNNGTESEIKLSSLSVKYEVKERIR